MNIKQIDEIWKDTESILEFSMGTIKGCTKEFIKNMMVRSYGLGWHDGQASEIKRNIKRLKKEIEKIRRKK
jgi:hypothetical protein